MLSICPTGHSVNQKRYFEEMVLQNIEIITAKMAHSILKTASKD